MGRETVTHGKTSRTAVWSTNQAFVKRDRVEPFFSQDLACGRKVSQAVVPPWDRSITFFISCSSPRGCLGKTTVRLTSNSAFRSPPGQYLFFPTMTMGAWLWWSVYFWISSFCPSCTLMAVLWERGGGRGLLTVSGIVFPVEGRAGYLPCSCPGRLQETLSPVSNCGFLQYTLGHIGKGTHMLSWTSTL